MKRMRTEGGLTGGTGDVNPQWLSFTVTQSAADTTTTATQTIPVQRLPTGGRAQVLELLRVIIARPTGQAIASATEAADVWQLYLSTASFGTTATNFAEPRVFASDEYELRGAFTAAGTYGFPLDRKREIDCTDGDGHGIIIATDQIYAQGVSSGTGAANVWRVKMLYRWKNVSLQEYIGVVQSQQ